MTCPFCDGPVITAIVRSVFRTDQACCNPCCDGARGWTWERQGNHVYPVPVRL